MEIEEIVEVKNEKKGNILNKAIKTVGKTIQNIKAIVSKKSSLPTKIDSLNQCWRRSLRMARQSYSPLLTKRLT